MMNFARGCIRNLGLVAMVVGGMIGQCANAAVVYTTKTVGQTNSSNNLVTYGANQPNTGGYGTGTFGATGSGNSWTSTNGIVAGSEVVIRFTAGGSLLGLTGINWSGYMDGRNGTAPIITATTGGVATWGLYQGTSTTAIATLTQNISGSFTTPGGQHSSTTPFYQANNFTSGFNLTSGQTYTLKLNSIAGINMTAASNPGTLTDLHMSYYSGTPIVGANGGGYSNFVTGSLTTAYTGTLTAGSNFTSRNMAFDLNATAVPEPSTLILYSAAAGGFFFFTFLRWRKAKANSELVVA